MDLYIVLGVAHEATEGEIRRAYRRLARRYHPDVNPGDQAASARFKEIVEAYETLVDPITRSRYDAGGAVKGQAVAHGSGFEGFDFSARGVDYSATFGDLFAEVLTERGDRQATGRGADLHQELDVSFEEALLGGSRDFSLVRRVHCRRCAGGGRAPSRGAACAQCQGAGVVKSVRGYMVFSGRCGGCGGSGRQRERPCEACGGTGQEAQRDTLSVEVPRGIVDGARLVMAGKGNAGVGGGPSGDLYLTVRVGAHPAFRRDGDDLHATLALAVHEAALGARVEVPTLEGPARLRVPPGTQSGQRFRLRGRGAPAGQGDHRGDLVIEARIHLPRLLDERSKELLREFGRINSESVRE